MRKPIKFPKILGRSANGNSGKADADTPDADYKIIRKRVASLIPSPENLEIYNKISQADPEIIKLAESIKKHGCDPLTITLDNYVVSGHRRLAALLRNGQQFVECRVLPVRRDAMNADEYKVLLRSYNHQRHKSVVEQVREELIDINPEEAHSSLREYRDRSINAADYNGVKPMKIEGAKKRCAIGPDKAAHVKYIMQIVRERRKFWPLSVRGVHYPLLNFDFVRGYYWPRSTDADYGTKRVLRYCNDDGSYQATSDLITRLRLLEKIPWEAFDDITRPLKEYLAFSDVKQFIRHEVKNFLRGYWRKLLQTQPNHIEVVCEKNTIYHMVLGVTKKYQIPTSSGRGFNSIDPWHDMAQRYWDSGKKNCIVITLTDWDPEGQMIPQVGARTLRDDFGIAAKFYPAGVTREQIDDYQLPPQNFAKEDSSNRDWFIARNNGDDTVYELEALEPQDMLDDLDQVIRSVIDIDLFNAEVEREKGEAAYLEAAQKTALEALKDLMD